MEITEYYNGFHFNNQNDYYAILANIKLTQS